MRQQGRWEDYLPRRSRNRKQRAEKRADVKHPSVFRSFRHVGQNVSLDIENRNKPIFIPFCPFPFLSDTAGSDLAPQPLVNIRQNNDPLRTGKGRHLACLQDPSHLVEENGFEPLKPKQQIYSLPPLTTRELLPIHFSQKMVELVDGFEPPTC